MAKTTEGVNKKPQKLVQMRFFQETIDKVNLLVKLRNARNKTQVVSEAISVFTIICKAVQEGANIVLVYPGERREKIILP